MLSTTFTSVTWLSVMTWPKPLAGSAAPFGKIAWREGAVCAIALRVAETSAGSVEAAARIAESSPSSSAGMGKSRTLTGAKAAAAAAGAGAA